ncbi:hypothetical protein SAMN05421736_111122 [Evansella caseinilytica]|uniref:Uncharacterized protein n=1 Tax=Evansella caseinilytica TaxID=1503961 RepID=A0A1H3SNM4_9BACI|nr:hypothetical protein SAMN05421736_111122 [Evansella caseinilytica]
MRGNIATDPFGEEKQQPSGFFMYGYVYKQFH